MVSLVTNPCSSFISAPPFGLSNLLEIRTRVHTEDTAGENEVVLEVLAHRREVDLHGDAERLQNLAISNTAKLENVG